MKKSKDWKTKENQWKKDNKKNMKKDKNKKR